MAVISGLIILRDGSPIFYSQTRIGKRSKPFTLFKFRTMISGRGYGSAPKLADFSRTTCLGRWLRHYHLDELPQLFNIIKGEMSFVGPRPEIPSYYDASFKPVEHVRPGMIDSATLYWINEDWVLNEVDDRDHYYRSVILPDKLARSTDDIAAKSVAHDAGLLLKAVWIVFLGGRRKTSCTNPPVSTSRPKVLSR